MAKVDRKALLAVLERRFDWYSAQVVLDEALAKAGLAGRDVLGPAELGPLSALLAGLRTRMEWVSQEVARLGGVEVPAAPAPAKQVEHRPGPEVTPPAQHAKPPDARPAAPAAKAAAPAAKAAAPAAHPPATEPKAAGAPAPSAAVDVAAGAATEASAKAGAPIRITAGEPGTVRWGINGWKTPPPAHPEGTLPVPGEPTVDTPLRATGAEPAFALVLGPLGGEVAQLDFTVRFEGDRWAPPCTVRLA